MDAKHAREISKLANSDQNPLVMKIVNETLADIKEAAKKGLYSIEYPHENHGKFAENRKASRQQLVNIGYQVSVSCDVRGLSRWVISW